MTHTDPVVAAVFLLAAFTLAGTAQTAWFAAPISRAFAVPLDGGLHFRGHRLFGANKTARGFVVMVPAAAAAFVLLANTVSPWPLPVSSYAWLGAWAAVGFMAGELPNSFLKRQLGIPPGAAPQGHRRAGWHFVLDRLDSGIGMLAALTLAVEVPWLTWLYILTLGPFIHWAFSVVLFRLGLKQRAA